VYQAQVISIQEGIDAQRCALEEKIGQLKIEHIKELKRLQAKAAQDETERQCVHDANMKLHTSLQGRYETRHLRMGCR
jgi:hypothetical protein